jgi:hypothetical protein
MITASYDGNDNKYLSLKKVPRWRWILAPEIRIATVIENRIRTIK